jgi:hypothetical protein
LLLVRFIFSGRWKYWYVGTNKQKTDYLIVLLHWSKE